MRWYGAMRRAGRIGTNSRHHAEAVWVMITLAAFVLVIAAIAIVGAKPPAVLVPPTVAPVVGSHAALQQQVTELKQRIAAEELVVTRVTKNLTTKVEELHRDEGEMAAMSARVKDEVKKRQQAEADLSTSQAKLDEAEKSQKQLEDEISSWPHNTSGNRTSADQVLKHFEATLAQAQVKLAKSQRAARDEGKRRQVLESQLAEVQSKLRSEEKALETQRNATGQGQAALEAKLASAEAKAAGLEEQLRQAQSELAKAGVAIPTPAPEGGVRSWLTRSWVVFLIGLAGVLSVLGPSTFVHVFLPVVASAVGGLLAAGCAEFFVSESAHASLQDSCGLLLDGTGGWFGYFLWIVLLILGVLRWIFAVECSLWDVVDDVVMAEPDGKDLGAPLLDNAGVHRSATDKSEGPKGRPPLPPPHGPPS